MKINKILGRISAIGYELDQYHNGDHTIPFVTLVEENIKLQDELRKIEPPNPKANRKFFGLTAQEFYSGL